MTNDHQKNLHLNCILNGENKRETIKPNNKSFNFMDFYYLLSRSFKNSVIRGWKLELIKAFCLMIGLLFLIILYPNDVGSDPSCPIDITSDVNLTETTNRIYDFANGKKKDAELNVAYLVLLIFYFGFVYGISISFLFPNEIKVSMFI